MNENVFVKEYDFDKLLIQKIDCIFENFIRDCHNKYFHTFDHICVYDIIYTNSTNNETVNFTISGRSMSLYERNKKLTVARQNSSTFNQIKKLTIKIYSNLSIVNEQ